MASPGIPPEVSDASSRPDEGKKRLKTTPVGVNSLPIRDEINELLPLAPNDGDRLKLDQSYAGEENAFTLEDLPVEILENILAKAVAMEIRERMQITCPWKEAAAHVMDRLSKVCSEWSNCLATSHFQLQLKMNLFGHEPILLKTLSRLQILHPFCDVTTMQNHIYMLCRPVGQEYAFHVHNRKTMAKVAEVALPGTAPTRILGCDLSRCLYILNTVNNNSEIHRVVKIGGAHYNIGLWITIDWVAHPIAVSPSGIIVLSRQQTGRLSELYMYDPNGSLSKTISLSPGIPLFRNIIPRSDSNFLVASFSNERRTDLFEVDGDGEIKHKYQSCLRGIGIELADSTGKILIVNPFNRIELLSSNFQLLATTAAGREAGVQVLCSGEDLLKIDVARSLFYWHQLKVPNILHYDRSRNEVLWVKFDPDTQDHMLMIFCLREY